MSRRKFMGTAAAAAGITIVPRHVLGGTGFQAPSDTVNVAVVGYAHGMGTSNLMNVAKSDNIVALCDCDTSEAAKAAMAKHGMPEKFPKAVLHQDFRKMLEKQKDIDAVVVATPDHNHAVVAMAAMQLGKHVYVQKPLTRTVSEARALTEAARKYKVVTQMGNQGHSEEGLRLMQEWVAAGAIGPIREVHCWTNRPVWPQGMPAADRHAAGARRPRLGSVDRPGADAPVQPGVPPVPLARVAGLRRRRDGRHGLPRHGRRVHDAEARMRRSASSRPRRSTSSRSPGAGTGGRAASASMYNDSYPPSSVIHLSFPARGDMPPVKLHWYDGGILPERPDELEPERKLPESGTIFVGDKGKMWCETYSESPRLIPESAMTAFTPRPPKTLPRVPGRAERPREELARRDPAEGPGGLELRLRRAVHRGRCCSATWRCASPAQRLMWDGPNMKITNVRGGRPVRPAQLPAGLVAARTDVRSCAGAQSGVGSTNARLKPWP